MSGLDRHLSNSPEQPQRPENQQLNSEALSHLNTTKPADVRSTDTAAIHLPELQLVDNKAEWTIAVDLTSDLMNKDGSVCGAHQKSEQLQQLVEESKGH